MLPSAPAASEIRKPVAVSQMNHRADSVPSSCAYVYVCVRRGCAEWESSVAVVRAPAWTQPDVSGSRHHVRRPRYHMRYHMRLRGCWLDCGCLAAAAMLQPLPPLADHQLISQQ
jgi:hypothetical protein